tara:strand:+ start:2990 stop:3721 length:732 start_codon:yes stop_codon:yes gene_type:complete
MKGYIELMQSVLSLLKASLGKGNSEDEEIKDALEWFLKQVKIENNKRVAKVKTPILHNGKIYVFNYTAKHKDRLAYWDSHPILLFLGYTNGASGKLMVGLNISWYPPKARKYLVEKIASLYKDKIKKSMKDDPLDAIEQKPVMMDLYSLKQALDQFGLSFALRTYIPANIKDPLICVAFEDWDKMIRIDSPNVFPQLNVSSGHTLASIYLDYADSIKKFAGNRTKWQKNMEDNKKLQKYTFIK